MNIVLVHSISHIPNKLVGFYDGHLIAHDGVLTIPINGEQSFRWAKQAFYIGYNKSPDGRTFRTWPEIEREMLAPQPQAVVVGSAESAEKDKPRLDPWRQPGIEHRIRASQSGSDEVIPEARVGSRKRRRVAEASD